MLGIPAQTTMTRGLIAATVTILAAYLFQRSSVGLRLRASREDEVAASAYGVWVARDRTIACVMSAAFVGLGGFLFAEEFGVFNPDDFYLNVTFVTIAMLVVGGINSLAGAVVGPVVISAVLEGLDQLEGGIGVGSLHVTAPPGSSSVGLALIMLAILLFRPAGLTGGKEFRWPWAVAAPVDSEERAGTQTGDSWSAKPVAIDPPRRQT
jgi:branched-chain amino acid transport system permease protein